MEIRWEVFAFGLWPSSDSSWECKTADFNRPAATVTRFFFFFKGRVNFWEVFVKTHRCQHGCGAQKNKDSPHLWTALLGTVKWLNAHIFLFRVLCVGVHDPHVVNLLSSKLQKIASALLKPVENMAVLGGWKEILLCTIIFLKKRIFETVFKMFFLNYKLLQSVTNMMIRKVVIWWWCPVTLTILLQLFCAAWNVWVVEHAAVFFLGSCRKLVEK